MNISLTQVGGSSADLIGVAVTITDDDSGDTLLAASWNGSTITTEIDINTNYTVSVETIAGFLPCASQSYQADYQFTRNIIVQYKTLGIYIEDVNGILYTSNTWSAENTPNSIVLLLSSHKFRFWIHKVEGKYIAPNYGAGMLNFITFKTSDLTAAKNDFNGQRNTLEELQYLASVGKENDTTFAAPYAHAFEFAYKRISGYIATCGQLDLIYQNKSQIESLLNVCGGDSTLNVQYYYGSSTFYNYATTDSSNVWMYYMNGDRAGTGTMGHCGQNPQILICADYK